MAYFGGSHGMRGDPGFFGTLFGAVKGAAGSVFRASPIGAAIRGARGAIRPTPQLPTFFQPPSTSLLASGVPRRGAGVAMIPFAPRRRRMNAGNPKALRRAIRRQNAFVNLAKGALKNSGFKVVSTSSGKVSRATMDKAVAKARADAHHAK